MGDVFTGDWGERYVALADPRSGPIGTSALSRAGLFLCGMSTCVDARVDMHNMQPLLNAPAETPAGQFAAMLLARAAKGIGGEVRADWGTVRNGCATILMFATRWAAPVRKQPGCFRGSASRLLWRWRTATSSSFARSRPAFYWPRAMRSKPRRK